MQWIQRSSCSRMLQQEQEQWLQGIECLVKPEFDSIGFPQKGWPMYAPSPYDGWEYTPNGFLLQCHLDYKNLVESKPSMWTWFQFMLSWLMGMAHELTELLCLQQQPYLYDPEQFYAFLKFVFPLVRHPDPLEFFFGGWTCVHEPEANREAFTPALPPEADWVACNPVLALPPRASKMMSSLCFLTLGMRSLHYCLSSRMLSLCFLTAGMRSLLHCLASRMMSLYFLTAETRSSVCHLALRMMSSLCLLMAGMRSLHYLQGLKMM